MSVSMSRLDALEQELERVRKESKQRTFQHEQLEALHKNTLSELKDSKRKHDELQSQVRVLAMLRAMFCLKFKIRSFSFVARASVAR